MSDLHYQDFELPEREDDELVTMGDNGVRYPDVLWLEDVAGASGRELRDADVSDCAAVTLADLERLGQLTLLDRSAA